MYGRKIIRYETSLTIFSLWTQHIEVNLLKYFIALSLSYFANKLKFAQILQYLRLHFEDKKCYPYLKISRPGVFDIRCVNWNTAVIVFKKKCLMDRSHLKSHVYWDTLYHDMVIPAVRTVVLKLAGLSQSLCNPKFKIFFDKLLYYLNKFKQFLVTV